jgi:hypothetical protein
MKLLKSLLPIIIFATGIFYFSNASPYRDHDYNRDRYHYKERGEYKDCDDMLAECGDNCKKMKGWWWEKKRCENNCIKAYNKCIEEEDY